MTESVNTQGISVKNYRDYTPGMARSKSVRPFWAATYRALADEKGKTVSDVAEALGKTPGAVTHWLNGHREVTLNQFLDLCRVSGGLDPVAVLYPGYIPQEFRERVQGLAKDVLAAKPADRPNYRPQVAALKRRKATAG